MAPFALKVIRFGLGLVNDLTPTLGARLSYRLFCRTDSRRPKGKKAQGVHAEGMAILARARAVPVAVGDVTVMSYRFDGSRADAPKALIAHGWGSSAAYLAMMAAGLAATGATVVVMDLPGHGRSSGRHLDIGLAARAISAVAKAHGGVDHLIGHSFGGATSLIAVSGFMPGVPALDVRQLAIIGAPSRFDFIFTGFAKMLGLSKATLQRLEEDAERQTGRHPDSFKGEELAAGLSIPVLVLHAEDDKEVLADNARRYEGLGPRVSVEWANGFGHRRIVSAKPVIDRLSDFIWGGQEANRSEAEQASG